MGHMGNATCSGDICDTTGTHGGAWGHVGNTMNMAEGDTRGHK